MKWYDRLKELRGTELIEKVCEDLNISPNTYEAYESGTRMPPSVVKNNISKYFNVSQEQIFG